MSHLHLNIFPIKLPDAELSVGVLPLGSKDAMRELRKEHASTHVFNRVSVEEDGKFLDLVYAVRLDGAECTIAPETKMIRLLDNLGVARQMVNESFISGFFGKTGREVVDVGPLKVLSSEGEHDFIAQAVNGAPVPPWLKVRLAHIIEARVFHFDGEKPFLGLVFDHHTYRRIARPCSDWLAENLSLEGLYISETYPFNDARILPRARLVGRVASVTGGTLHLTDYREGRNSVEAKDVEIEADYEGFLRCLNKTFKGNGNAINRRLFDLQSAAQVGPKKLGELERVETRLIQKPIRLLPGLEAPVLSHINSKGTRFPTVSRAPAALYVFDRTFNKPALTDAKIGISDRGPYSQVGFTPSKPRICVICDRSRKGEVEQFIQKLLEGHNEPGRRCYFPDGLIKTYRLQGKEVRFFLAESQTAAAYRKAAQEALAAVTTEAERWHLAFVQVDQASHEMRGDTNPYLVAKATFLSQQTPTQEFMIETSRRNGSGLDFILSNIALASYAKLGGTPWHLKVNNPMAHELVTLRLSRGLAQRIVFQTGVDPFSLTGPLGTQPLSLLDGQTYTGMSYLGWLHSKNPNSPDERRIIMHGEILKDLVEELLFVSAIGPRKNFAGVVWSLCQAIGDITEAYQLRPSVALFRTGKFGPEDRCRYELRKKMAFLCRILGRLDLPSEAAMLERERLGDAHLFIHATEHPEAEHALQVLDASAERTVLLELLRLRSMLDKGPMSGFPVRKRGRPPKNASKRI